MSQFAFNPYKKTEVSSGIQADKFFEWSQNHFYRTSTNDMSVEKKQVDPKNVAMAGYAGFIPGMRSESAFSKKFPQITRENFAQKAFGVNTYGLATTGFNSKSHDFIDTSKQSHSHKYGKSSIIKNHVCINGEPWQSQTKETYQNPCSLTKPTFRETGKTLVSLRPLTKQSGFLANINVCDGQGWPPIKELEGDRTHTNYRLDISRTKPIHRDTIKLNLRKLHI